MTDETAGETANKRSRRLDVKAILADPDKRRRLMVDALIALQAVAGIETSREQAEAAYDKVRRFQAEK